MEKFNKIEENNYYIGVCKIGDNEKKIIKSNPHCAEFFCNKSNIGNCTTCSKVLTDTKKFMINPLYTKEHMTIAMKQINQTNSNNMKCKNTCMDGYLYDFIPKDYEIGDNNSIYDSLKTLDKFYKGSLIYKYDDIPFIEFEHIRPRPITVVHWGQLKMFLVILMFLTKVVEPSDKVVHIIYPGSARGDNILILSDMFPNVRWNLIDPAVHHQKLFKHNRVDEIKTEFFTDETAKYFANKFSKRDNDEKLLFMSDIRVDPSDSGVKRDNMSDMNWYNILKPNYGYLKFRCPYESGNTYEFIDGKIYIQPFAPVGSTESRLFCSGELKPKIYNVKEYQGKFFYFNRILRPSYYTQSLIETNDYFDHCYDCTYFSHLIKNYKSKFPNNIFKDNTILETMNKIKERLLHSTMDRIKLSNEHIRHNIY